MSEVLDTLLIEKQLVENEIKALKVKLDGIEVLIAKYGNRNESVEGKESEQNYDYVSLFFLKESHKEPVRYMNVLMRGGCNIIKDLTYMNLTDILRLRGMGESGKLWFLEFCKKYNIKVGSDSLPRFDKGDKVISKVEVVLWGKKIPPFSEFTVEEVRPGLRGLPTFVCSYDKRDEHDGIYGYDFSPGEIVLAR